MKQQFSDRHVAPIGHIILIPSQPLFALWCILSGEATNTNLIVFGLTRSGLELTIYCTRSKHFNHYTTDAVLYIWYATEIFEYKTKNFFFNTAPPMINVLFLSHFSSPKAPDDLLYPSSNKFSHFNLFYEITGANRTKLDRNVNWMIIFYSLWIDPMGIKPTFYPTFLTTTLQRWFLWK